MATSLLLNCFNQLTTDQLEAPAIKLLTILCTIIFFTLVSGLTFLLSSQCDMIKSKKDMATWCVRVIRLVFGVCGTILGFYLVVWDDTLRKDIVHAKTPLSVLGAHFLVGKFLFDVTFNIFFNAMDRLMWLHHVITTILCTSVAYYEMGHYMVGASLLSEMVAPFVTFRWVLLRMDDRPWVRLCLKVNQIVLVLL